MNSIQQQDMEECYMIQLMKQSLKTVYHVKHKCHGPRPQGVVGKYIDTHVNSKHIIVS